MMTLLSADRAGILIIVALTAMFYGSIIAVPDTDMLGQLIPSLFTLAGGTIGTCWLLKPYRTAAGRDRVFWLLLSLGTASHVLVNLVYGGFIVAHRLELYYEGPNIIGALPKLLFASALALKIRQYHHKAVNPIKPYIMNIIVFVSVTVTLSIHYSLGPVWAFTNHAYFFSFAVLAYPVLVWIFILVVAYFYHISRDYMASRTLHALFAGCMILAAADIGAILPFLNGDLSTVRLLEPIWLLAMLMVGYAGRTAQHEAPRPQPDAGLGGASPAKDPILSYASVVLLLIVQTANSWSGISVLNIGLSITFVIVIVHQLMLLRNNRALMLRYSHLAHYDALTGLKNRVRFREEIELQIQRAAGTGTTFSLLLVDLDGFKQVNDTYGHHVGDELLRVVAGRFMQALDGKDTVYRMGGDEFVILVPGTEQQGTAAAQGVIDRLHEPIVIEGNRVAATPSIGISAFPTDGGDSAMLLKRADAAMYEAKTKGKNQFRHYRG